MNVTLSTEPIHSVAADVLILPLAETGDKPPAAAGFDASIGSWLDDLYSSGEFKGKLFETATLHRPAGLKVRRLTVTGTGKPDKSADAEIRLAIGAALRTVKKFSATSVAVHLPEAPASAVSAAVEGTLLGDWESDVYRSKNDRKAIDSIAIAVPSGADDLKRAVDRGRILAESQNFTRNLANEPPNHLKPLVLAERARAMAAEQGLECEVLDRARMEQLGMGSLLGVAMGSAEPPALIVLRYRPADGPAGSTDHLGLVGKGVTFDTGGISIKPADNMDKMKYDMGGGATMLGAMRAIAQLKPSIPVTALIPTVENMPGGKAQRPGDIVKSLSGKTIEVLNTDAEGRLILNDAITYAKRLGCTHLIDAATLTGAIVVALGHIYTGVFTNNEAFGDKLLNAAKRQGEKFWPMPLDDEYRELLKSPFADIGNIGGRWGGAITAAMFLKEFAEDTPWIHLDIAGTVSYDDGKPYAAKGASGVCVRTLVDLTLNW
jgi:leucyl aminopeptidase